MLRYVFYDHVEGMVFLLIHRYQQTGTPADIAAASTFYFPVARGHASISHGQIFTVLKFKRTVDDVDCNVLLVDTRGQEGEPLDNKLYAVTKLKSQIVLFRGTTVANAVDMMYECCECFSQSMVYECFSQSISQCDEVSQYRSATPISQCVKDAAAGTEYIVTVRVRFRRVKTSRSKSEPQFQVVH